MKFTKRVFLIAHDVGGSGGMELVLEQIVHGLSDDIDLVVVSCSITPELARRVTHVRLPFRSFPLPARLIVFGVIASLIVHVRRRPGDVAHSMGCILLWGADIVTVPFLHAEYRRLTASHQRPKSLRWLNSEIASLVALQLERMTLRKKTRVALCPSRGMLVAVSKCYPEVATVLVPHGVDSDHFAPNLARRRASRLAMNIGDEERVGIFVGGDWRRKRLGLVFEALQLAPDALDRLLVVGGGDPTSLNVPAETRVDFFGVQSDVARFLAASDVFIFPSSYESFGLVAFEAAASGLPVIASHVHGVSEIVAAGGGIEANSASEIAAALRAVFANADNLCRMSRMARKAAEMYTWESANSLTLSQYLACG